MSYISIFRKSVTKIQVSLKSDKNKGLHHTNQHTFFIISRSIFLVWEMFQTNVIQKIKTHILCSTTFFFFENLAVYEIMWKNIVQPGRPQTTIWRK
jgi:hypothetical protein